MLLHMPRIGAAKLRHDPPAHGIDDVQELSMTLEAFSRAKTGVRHRVETHHMRLPWSGHLRQPRRIHQPEPCFCPWPA